MPSDLAVRRRDLRVFVRSLVRAAGEFARLRLALVHLRSCPLQRRSTCKIVNAIRHIQCMRHTYSKYVTSARRQLRSLEVKFCRGAPGR
jgi:hypothetical protein